jgi:ATP-dependent helicase HrpB
MRADLLDTVLLSKKLATDLRWPSPPPSERWKKSEELAILLGLLSENGELILRGKEVEKIPLDARLASAIISARHLSPTDQKKLIRAIAVDIEGDRSGNLERRLMPLLPRSEGNDPWERALLSGFVDQVARYRQKQNDFIHFSGKTLKAHRELRDLQYDFYLILDVTPRGEAYQIIPVLEEWLMELEPFPFHEENIFDVDKLRTKTRTMLGSIVMDESEKALSFSTLSEKDRKKFLELAETTFRKKLAALKADPRWEKLHFWARNQNVDLDEKEIPLVDFFTGYDSWNEFSHYVFSILDTENIQLLLPSKIDLGGRRELSIHYPMNLDPYVEAPIQDFYGQKSVPALLGGKFPLQVKLLGPHKRPIQVTKDLAGFWSRMYPEMKKEWSREYPRHYWPDDPANAKPFLLKKHVNP